MGTAPPPVNGVKTQPGGRGDSVVPGSDRFLTLREAAEVLRLHPRTVREYIRRGEIKGRLIGRRWRFSSVMAVKVLRGVIHGEEA